MMHNEEGFQQHFKTKLFKDNSSFCIDSLLNKSVSSDDDKKMSLGEASVSPKANGKHYLKTNLILTLKEYIQDHLHHFHYHFYSRLLLCLST